jgi:hypothetical protein
MLLNSTLRAFNKNKILSLVNLIIKVISSRKKKWVVSARRMGQKGIAYRTLIGKMLKQKKYTILKM